MNWFTISYFTPMVLLGLWLLVGIYLALRERLALELTRHAEMPRPARAAQSDVFSGPDAWYNITPSDVHQAYEKFVHGLKNEKAR